jgi:hypothetical protein
VEEYSTRENGSAQNRNSKKETGPGFKVNLCTVAALIAACIVVVLAVGSIIIALVAYINTNGEDGQHPKGDLWRVIGRERLLCREHPFHTSVLTLTLSPGHTQAQDPATPLAMP